MSSVRYSLLADGTSDQVLMGAIDWVLRREGVLIESRAWADLSWVRAKPKSLGERVTAAMTLYPCDILFVHRDSESEAAAVRYDEIEAAVRGVADHVVAIVPIRMTEAWLLHDVAAIRSASNNPNGTAALKLPRTRGVEQVLDAKQVLFDALLEATELSGRRRQKSKRDLPRMRARLADLIDDYSPLVGVPSFDALIRDVRTAVGSLP